MSKNDEKECPEDVKKIYRRYCYIAMRQWEDANSLLREIKSGRMNIEVAIKMTEMRKRVFSKLGKKSEVDIESLKRGNKRNKTIGELSW